MRKTILVLAFLLSALPVMASDADAVRAVLKTWLDALASNDLAAVERIIADDYVITAGVEGKVMNKQQDLAPLHSGRVKFESAEATDVNVRVFGNTAVVTGIGVFKVIGVPTTFRERFTDVYVKRKGRWQPVSSHTTPVKTGT
jgi:uncharacterized protein (TIGR02246 family)